MTRITALATALFCLLVAECSNPAGNNAVAWKANYHVPLINKKLYIKDLLGANSIVTDKDSVHAGDTLQIEIKDTFATTHRRTITTLGSYADSVKIGDMRLAGLPPLKFPLLLTLPTFSSRPLPKDHEFSLKAGLPLKSIEHVTFDATSAPSMITIRNTSSGAIITGATIVLFSDGREIASSAPISLLAPGAQRSAGISLAGITLKKNISAQLKGTVTQGSVIPRGTTIHISLDLNGLALEEATLIDSLLLFDFNYDFNYRFPIGESFFHLNYIDISHASLPLYIHNSTPLELEVALEIDQMWNAAYCKSRGVDTREKAQAFSGLDSLWYKGNSLAPVTIENSPPSRQAIYRNHTISLSDVRLFPDWDGEKQISTLPLSITARVSRKDTMVTISKHTGVGIRIPNPSLCFSRICGYYTRDTYVRGTPQHMPVSLVTQASSIFDALRNKFKFTHTDVDFGIEFLLPDNTWFSRLNTACIISQPGSENNADTLRWDMDNIRRASPKRFHGTLNELINSFPDSIGYAVDYCFPSNQPMVFDHGVISCGYNSASIVMNVQTEMKMVLHTVWEVDDTVRIIFDNTKLRLGFATRQIGALNDKTLRIGYTILNQTNINARLFALAGTERTGERLLRLTPAEIAPPLLATPRGNGLIGLLGSEGIGIEPVGATERDSITLPDRSMNDIAGADSLYIRWELVLPPSYADALCDTDYVHIEAELTLDGTQSTDGLFGGGEGEQAW